MQVRTAVVWLRRRQIIAHSAKVSFWLTIRWPHLNWSPLCLNLNLPRPTLCSPYLKIDTVERMEQPRTTFLTQRIYLPCHKLENWVDCKGWSNRWEWCRKGRKITDPKMNCHKILTNSKSIRNLLQGIRTIKLIKIRQGIFNFLENFCSQMMNQWCLTTLPYSQIVKKSSIWTELWTSLLSLSRSIICKISHFSYVNKRMELCWNSLNFSRPRPKSNESTLTKLYPNRRNWKKIWSLKWVIICRHSNLML